MRALEKSSDVAAALKSWRRSFADGAEVIGTMDAQPVLWHPRLGIWGLFGRTRGKEPTGRSWNAFGQRQQAFRSNIIVEMNQPPRGIDTNLQAVFALDDQGRRWLLHQGRMSVAGSRVTEADFMAATNLKPIPVRFSDGSARAYHKVVDLQAAPASIQDGIAAFVEHCARARLIKTAGRQTVEDVAAIKRWEHGLRPEQTDDYEIGPRETTVARRFHGEVWRALAAELKRRGVPHTNDRLGLHGPDMFTYGDRPKVLFEIKTGHGAQDIFTAVGQLHIYERLLKSTYRRTLVLPRGMRRALQGPVAELGIATVEFHREGRRIRFDDVALDHCLA